MKIFILGVMSVQLVMIGVGITDLVFGNLFDGCMGIGLNVAGLLVNIYALREV